MTPQKNKPERNFTPRLSLRIVLIVPFVLQIFAAVGLVGYLSFQICLSFMEQTNHLKIQLEVSWDANFYINYTQSRSLLVKICY